MSVSMCQKLLANKHHSLCDAERKFGSGHHKTEKNQNKPCAEYELCLTHGCVVNKTIYMFMVLYFFLEDFSEIYVILEVLHVISIKLIRNDLILLFMSGFMKTMVITSPTA